MKIVEKELEQYVKDHSTAQDAVLTELERVTHLRLLKPRMLSGHLQGKLLEMLVRMHRPKRVLEIGTFTGYSAICMAKALQPDGELHTIDPNDEIAHIATAFFEKSGTADRIRYHIGSALDVAPRIGGCFDFVFIDGDKREYPQYYEMLFDCNLVGAGSVIVADNTLWDGKVTDLSEKNLKDKHTSAVLRFNQIVAHDSRVEVLLLPFRDGLSLITVK